MPVDRLTTVLQRHVADLETAGTAKGAETVVVGVKRAEGGRGPRFLLEGEGDKEFLRMNSNSYLGLGLHPAVIEAEEKATEAFGAGPARCASSRAATQRTRSSSARSRRSTTGRRA